MSQMNPTRDEFAALLDESFAKSDLYEGTNVFPFGPEVWG